MAVMRAISTLTQYILHHTHFTIPRLFGLYHLRRCNGSKVPTRGWRGVGSGYQLHQCWTGCCDEGKSSWYPSVVLCGDHPQRWRTRDDGLSDAMLSGRLHHFFIFVFTLCDCDVTKSPELAFRLYFGLTSHSQCKP